MRRITILLLLGILTLAGCTGDKGKDLFETAQFEEQQHNQEHAVQLYREILKKYPDSSYAEKAGKRLAEIQKSR
jgi:outer membrane protein assembly factor BamD (BamD/ComL family)